MPKTTLESAPKSAVQWQRISLKKFREITSPHFKSIFVLLDCATFEFLIVKRK